MVLGFENCEAAGIRGVEPSVNSLPNTTQISQSLPQEEINNHGTYFGYFGSIRSKGNIET
jgi:hypothetical protein